jgi:hypothetical protein
MYKAPPVPSVVPSGSGLPTTNRIVPFSKIELYSFPSICIGAVTNLLNEVELAVKSPSKEPFAATSSPENVPLPVTVKPPELQLNTSSHALPFLRFSTKPEVVNDH